MYTWAVKFEALRMSEQFVRYHRISLWVALLSCTWGEAQPAELFMPDLGVDRLHIC